MAEETEKAEQKDSKKKPSLRWLWLSCPLLVIAAALHSADQPIGGGDTWVAMACGRYTLGDWERPEGMPHPVTQQPHRTLQMKILDLFGVHITHVDPFSARSRPYNPGVKDQEGWINQNWLTHCIFYGMYERFGENSIVIYKFIQAILTGLFCYWAGRALGAHPVLAALAASFGLLLSRSYIDLRPNVSSILFAAIMIFLIARWRSGRHKSLLWMIPVMLIWSNVHGGFIYAIMIFTIILFAYSLQIVLRKGSIALLLGGLIVSVILMIKGARFVQGNVDEPEVKMFSDVVFANQILLWLGIFMTCSAVLIGLLALVRYSFLPGELYHSLHPNEVEFWNLVAMRGIKPAMSGLFARAGGYFWLVVGFGLVLFMPVIFSPFGLENLTHPLLIAVGDEGAKWRGVYEWRPIYEQGFGQIVSYMWFLMVLGFFMAVWGVLVLFPPLQKQIRKRFEEIKTPESWPRIDVALIAIVAMTVAMSIQSRRFVFLGGIVLAPLMAMYAQDVINMIVLKFRSSRTGADPLLSPRLPFIPAAILAALCLVGAVWVGIVFERSMQSEYFSPMPDGQKLSVFMRMVGIDDQPVEAMPFFDLNGLNGVVFNEWTNGGYVPFWQTPVPETGEPPVKVYMDGRAQAAYTVSHYDRSSDLRMKKLPNSPSVSGLMQNIAKQLKIEPKGDFYPEIIRRIKQDNPVVWQQLQRAKFIDHRLRVAMDQFDLSMELRGVGLSESDPDCFERLVQQRHDSPEQFSKLAKMSYGNPDLYGALLASEGINITLMSYQKHSDRGYQLLTEARKWHLVYLDRRYVIFLYEDSPRNAELFKKPLEALHFPGDDGDRFARLRTIGFVHVRSGDANLMRKGVEMLVQLQEWDPQSYNLLYRVGRILKMDDVLIDFFKKQYDHFASLTENKDIYRLFYQVNAALDCGQYLHRLYIAKKMDEQANKLREELNRLNDRNQRLREEQQEEGLF